MKRKLLCLKKYIDNYKYDIPICNSIIVKNSPINIWEIYNNQEHFEKNVLKVKNHSVETKGEKNKKGFLVLLKNLKTGMNIKVRVKNIKIYENKIMVYLRKEVNGKKALNYKTKVIITEISKNFCIVQIDTFLSAGIKGNDLYKIQNWIKYILKKSKKELDIC